MSERSNPERIEEMRRQLQHLQNAHVDNERRLADLDARRRTTSPDGLVTITTGPGGTVTEIQVTDHALRLTAAEISRLLTETVRAATSPPTATGTTPQPAPPRRRRAEPDQDEPLSTVYD